MILMCLKNTDSYKRIAHGLNGYELSDNLETVEEIVEIIDLYNFEISILDKRLIFFNEIESLLKENKIKIIYFDGSFKDVIEPIIENIPLKAVDEELSSEEEQEEFLIQREFTRREVVTEIEYVDKYTSLYIGVENTIISVASPFERAGSSFISANLAAHFAKYNIFTSVVALPDNYYFFRLIGIDKIIEKKKEEYISPHHAIDDGGLYKKKDFIHDKISFISADPRLEKISIDDWKSDKVSKLIHYSKAPIKIIDLGTYDGDHLEEILSISDVILVLIDPDPMEIMNRTEELKRYVELSKIFNVTFVINKYAEGVENLESLLESKYKTIPIFDSKAVYTSIYNYKIPYHQIEQEFDRYIFAITSKIIPVQLLDVDSKKSKDLLTIFKNKFKR